MARRTRRLKRPCRATGTTSIGGAAAFWRIALTGCRLAIVLKISHNLVAKAWQRAGLQPHRFERHMQSDDPDFERKAADVIGLYLDPPQHAAVFAVDEKTAIQALDRLDPVL